MSTVYSTEGGNTTAVFNPGGEREQEINTRAFLTENVGVSFVPLMNAHGVWNCLRLKGPNAICSPFGFELSTILKRDRGREIQKKGFVSPTSRRQPRQN